MRYVPHGTPQKRAAGAPSQPPVATPLTHRPAEPQHTTRPAPRETAEAAAAAARLLVFVFRNELEKRAQKNGSEKKYTYALRRLLPTLAGRMVKIVDGEIVADGDPRLQRRAAPQPARGAAAARRCVAGAPPGAGFRRLSTRRARCGCCSLMPDASRDVCGWAQRRRCCGCGGRRAASGWHCRCSRTCSRCSARRRWRRRGLVGAAAGDAAQPRGAPSALGARFSFRILPAWETGQLRRKTQRSRTRCT